MIAADAIPKKAAPNSNPACKRVESGIYELIVQVHVRKEIGYGKNSC
jgi:hypothetical protein